MKRLVQLGLQSDLSEMVECLALSRGMRALTTCFPTRDTASLTAANSLFQRPLLSPRRKYAALVDEDSLLNLGICC